MEFTKGRRTGSSWRKRRREVRNFLLRALSLNGTASIQLGAETADLAAPRDVSVEHLAEAQHAQTE